ncbi:LysR family transcriptional regulator [Rubrivivax gelatinosus]|uniref:LysR family transcriptional regulator n=1 Tax=Rubrivivax gelatinosus TaxID=28068 RepID=A0ABS1DUP4_RUBGE|nr:LysR substrate-binding domain-containing protein [Rubrivivax gelatinosus]MBK1614267.1 LysR family transcriptional regulator [Rubrivivax gelatinosus]MBK1713443.1 LysR family transcriptional regulator [Rubrivivax gelatinosus]
MNLLDAYRYLVALEQHRHFGRAAAACHITQPALSNALRALEERFEVAIVRRGRHYEGLTPEGERVLASAHRLLHEQELLEQDLRAGRPQGRLVIGAVPTALPVAARLAARLVEQHPGVQPQVRSLASQEIELGLENLALDLGIGYVERAPARLATLPQYVERHYLLQRARRSGVVLGFGSPMPWAEAAALPLALLSPEMHNRAILDGVFRELGLAPRPAIETNSVLALLVAVQAGGVAAVLPGALVSTLATHGELEARPLVGPELLTPIGLMTAAGARRSRALEAALALAQGEDWLAHLRAHTGTLEAAARQRALRPD